MSEGWKAGLSGAQEARAVTTAREYEQAERGGADAANFTSEQVWRALTRASRW
jgi:hypothetical protein